MLYRINTIISDPSIPAPVKHWTRSCHRLTAADPPNSRSPASDIQRLKSLPLRLRTRLLRHLLSVLAFVPNSPPWRPQRCSKVTVHHNCTPWNPSFSPRLTVNISFLPRVPQPYPTVITRPHNTTSHPHLLPMAMLHHNYPPWSL